MKLDLIKVLKNIEAKYSTAEDTFAFFELHSDKKELGVVSIDHRARKLDLRGENTASVACYPELRFVDYGDCDRDGVSSIIDLIKENTNCNFSTAVKILASWENEEIEDIEAKVFEKRTIAKEEKKVAPYTPYYIQQRIEERNLIENKEVFSKLVKGLFRGCNKNEMIAGIKAFNIGLTSYEETVEDGDEKKIVHRLFVPECDSEGVAFGCYKYNREIKGRKGLLRANAQRVLFGSHLIKYYKKDVPVILSEGHSDVIVNNSKYLQCITNGSSTKPITEWLPLLKGRTLHIYPDADYPGIKGATSRAIEIEEFNKTLENKDDEIKYKIFLWSEVFIEDTIEEFQKFQMPLSSLKTNDSLKRYSKQWWKDLFTDETLTSHIDKSIMAKAQAASIGKAQLTRKDKIELPKHALIENWTVLSKSPVKKGFDFIDFHEKNNKSPNYEPFLSKYKFK